MPSQYDKEAADRLAESIAADPHIYELADTIGELIGLRTDFDRAENRSCLLIDVLGRGMGSRKAAAEHMTVPGKWQRLLQISSELDGGAYLPWNPPTENRVRQWRMRFLPTGWRPDHEVVPETLRRIQAKVMELGVRRALELGQFPDDVDPDFTKPDRWHMLIGDGTWVREFSKAQLIDDPVLGQKRQHSRAKSNDTVREQQYSADWRKHKKKVTGVLHTVLITETRVGWVFLGGDQTFGGESDSILGMVDQLTDHLGDRIHTLCYDRGITGWPVNWLLARHGIPLVSTAKPATAAEKDPELKQLTLDAKTALAGLLPAKDRRTSSLIPVRVQQSLQKAANAEQMRDHRDRGLPAGIGQPLGRCYYLTSNDNVEKVISAYYAYKTLEHQRADGSVCQHHLYVDDGALWEAVQQGHEWVKAQRPTCLPARRVLDPDTGAWTRVMDWELTCTETGHVFRESTRWAPELHRGKPSKHRTRSPQEKAIEAMQPLPRCDVAFGKTYGRRNESESWFSWYKSTLRQGNTAASLSLDHQLLDLLFAGMVTNSRTLRRGRLTGLVAVDTRAA